VIPLKDNIPLLRVPIVSVALVLANLVVYLLAVAHGGDFFAGPSHGVAVHHGAIPSSLSWGPAFSSLFLHGSLLALLANLIALAIFALNVEDAMGRVRFIVFYLLAGLLTIALIALLHPNSSVPTLGASGAVAAVLGGYLRLYPRSGVISLAPIPFLATIVEVPAALLIGVWLLVQVWFGLAGLTGPSDGQWGVAFAADCCALLAGALAIGLFADRARSAAKRPPLRPVY
jgi:membrane associated rhomboid family serine protease